MQHSHYRRINQDERHQRYQCTVQMKSKQRENSRRRLHTSLRMMITFVRVLVSCTRTHTHTYAHTVAKMRKFRMTNEFKRKQLHKHKSFTFHLFRNKLSDFHFRHFCNASERSEHFPNGFFIRKWDDKCTNTLKCTLSQRVIWLWKWDGKKDRETEESDFFAFWNWNGKSSKFPENVANGKRNEHKI